MQPMYVRGSCRWALSEVIRASVQEKEREKKNKLQRNIRIQISVQLRRKNKKGSFPQT